MSKKKKQSQPLDGAALERITARRERKAGARADREQLRAEKAELAADEGLARRTAANADRLQAVDLALIAGDVVQAGVLKAGEGTWTLMYLDAMSKSSTHTDSVEAVMLLYAQEGWRDGEVRSRTAEGDALLQAAGNLLDEQYRVGQLAPLDVQTYYERFAGADQKRELEQRWRDDDPLTLWWHWQPPADAAAAVKVRTPRQRPARPDWASDAGGLHRRRRAG